MESLDYDIAVFGAGPAGLAAGLKLAENKKSVVILEKDSQVGGLSKTVEFQGYRFDIGGHRFFSKSSEVNALWTETLGHDFLSRPRLSRMYYQDKFFSYPVKPFEALWKLGPLESFIILNSYLKSKIFPIKEEKNFEQWVSNRFGKRLFKHFFKSYTEKLWGIPCQEIQAEWAAQRIKGLSLTSTIKSSLLPDKKEKIKTLIDKFYYPKYGPGMMYTQMAENLKKLGGKISLEREVTKINHANGKIISIETIDKNNKNSIIKLRSNHFISSMPITDLVKYLSPAAPEEVISAAFNLRYRSFLTINVILDSSPPFPDNWIYIHSPGVKMLRIQNFNNWSPYMVKDNKKTALGLEYVCNEGDKLWNMDNRKLIKLGLTELEKIKLGKRKDYLSGFVYRASKAYPIYDSTYCENMRIIREYLEQFSNLQPIGRYGMFKYNNMDHSILTGMKAAENILGASHNIWEINADNDYHEIKK